MRNLITALLMLVLLCSSAASALPDVVRMEQVWPAQSLRSHNALGDVSSEWNVFKTKFQRAYSDMKEEFRRMTIFANNLKKIAEHNKLFEAGHKTYRLGVNQHADKTHEEYKREVTGCFRNVKKASSGITYIAPAVKQQLPDSVDWRKKGAVTAVKDQGSCGSCWSFSTTGSLEGQHFRKSGKLVSLSEQQLVDCSGKYGNMGCNGGLMDNAFKYIEKFGIERESAYSYHATQSRCNYAKSKVAANCTGFVDVPHGDESALQQAVANVGPVSVAIDASHSSFQLYHDGVYNEPECSSSQLDHGVLVVGYGTSESGDDYWLVKNSWNTHWGDEGYIKMARNKDNQCGIASSASYPTV